MRELQALTDLLTGPPPADAAQALAAAAAAVTRTLALLHALAGQLADAQLRAQIAPLRRAFAASSFVRRAQTWLRGHPGDFEIVEQIVDAAPGAPPGTWGWYLDRVLLDAPIAAQHRHKVDRQARAIEDCVAGRAGTRMLSLGCGGGRDFLQASARLRDVAATIVLNDIDLDALALAQGRIAGPGLQVVPVPGHARRCVTHLAGGPGFDLIVIGGLLDYLPDAVLRRMLATIDAALLAPGGRCLFTNIAVGNPYRPMLQYIADWPLIERDEPQLLALCASIGITAERLTLEREPSGLTIVATLAAR